MCQAVKSAVGWAVTNSFNVHVFNVRGLSLSATSTTGTHMFMCQIGSKLSPSLPPLTLSLSLSVALSFFSTLFSLTLSQIANSTAINDVHPKCQTTASERCQETEASLTLVSPCDSVINTAI